MMKRRVRKRDLRALATRLRAPEYKRRVGDVRAELAEIIAKDLDYLANGGRIE